jgi:hypothetical protein
MSLAKQTIDSNRIAADRARKYRVAYSRPEVCSGNPRLAYHVAHEIEVHGVAGGRCVANFSVSVMWLHQLSIRLSLKMTMVS